MRRRQFANNTVHRTTSLDMPTGPSQVNIARQSASETSPGLRSPKELITGEHETYAEGTSTSCNMKASGCLLNRSFAIFFQAPLQRTNIPSDKTETRSCDYGSYRPGTRSFACGLRDLTVWRMHLFSRQLRSLGQQAPDGLHGICNRGTFTRVEVKRTEKPAATAVKALSTPRMHGKPWVEHIAGNHLQVTRAFRSQLKRSTEALKAPSLTTHDRKFLHFTA